MDIVIFGFSVVFLSFVIHGGAKGAIRVKGLGMVYRDQSPFLFWLSISWFVLGGLVLFCVSGWPLLYQAGLALSRIHWPF